MKTGSKTKARRWTLNTATIRGLMEDMRTGDLTPDEVVSRLRRLPHPNLGFALVDHQAALRHDLSEAVAARGLTPDRCSAIVAELLAGGASPVVLSRATRQQAAAVLVSCPGAVPYHHGDYMTLVWRHSPPRGDRVVALTAHSTDGPVLEECTAVLEAHGVAPVPVTDVSLSGLPRLLGATDLLLEAAAVVVAAPGGALATVVGGLTAAPIVAVPTSVSASSCTWPALLESYASGVTVVGEDDGFSAGCAVVRLLGAAAERPRP